MDSLSNEHCRVKELKLLLIEDGPLEKVRVRELLRREIAGTRRVALPMARVILKENRYDAIVLDSTASEADTLASVAEIRETAVDTPIIVVGEADTPDRRKAILSAGAQDLLVRAELNFGLLSQTLRHAVERGLLLSECACWRIRTESLRREKFEFAATMSHEILNSMTGVLGFANLLHKTELGVEQHEYLKMILDCTSSLAEMVTELLELSRLDDPHESAKKQLFSLMELVEELIMFVRPTRPRSDVRLMVDIDSALPLQQVGDRQKVRRLLYNLLQNALKFTETGHVLVVARLLQAGPETLSVRLMIEDTGRGIAEAKQRTIFEPFSQAEAADRRHGHGLGLAICTQLARALGGELRLRSTLGRGSRFWIDLEFDRDLAPRACQTTPTNECLAQIS